jgi:hypothetical protein
MNTLRRWIAALTFGACLVPLCTFAASWRLPKGTPLYDTRDAFMVGACIVYFVLLATHLSLRQAARRKAMKEHSE